MIADLEIIETGNGGDARLVSRDLFMISGWENMPYLAMFGGNLRQSTGATRAEAEQAFDWWGNRLLFSDTPELQFNSLTERRLNSVALNSSGRLLVEQAIVRDLEFMQAFAEISVETAITGPDRLEIRISIRKPEQLQEQVYIYLWDGILQNLSALSTSVDNADFNNDFNDDFNS
tara:strand:- start:1089 stop:1613 length:525 start_codon:yes stop_codon:yes gene_type:complete